MAFSLLSQSQITRANICYAFSVRVLALLGFFTFPLLSSAQKIDSLIDVYHQGPTIEVANRLSEYYFSKNVDSAEFWARSSYLLLNESTSDSSRGRVTGHLGLCLIESSKYDSAEHYLLIALRFQENMSKPDLKGLSLTYNSLGNLNFYLKNPLKTAEWYQKSLILDQRIGDKSRLAKSYGNMGLVYRAMRNDHEAINSYHESLKLLREVGDQSSELRILINLTSAFGHSGFKLHNLDSALHYGRQAIAVGELLNFQFGISKAKAVLCSVLIRKGYDHSEFLTEGLQMAIEVREFFSKTSYRFGYLDGRLNEGFAYEALGQPQKAIKIAKEVKGEGFAIYECNRLISKAFKRMGRDKEALEYFESYQKTLDSIRLNNERTKLAEFQLGFETEKLKSEKAEAEIKVRQAENRNHRNRLFFIAAALIALLISLIAVFYTSREKQKKKTELALVELNASQKQLALEKQYRDSELKALKSQMNPHFIFNVLNSIQEYIVLNNKVQASDYLAMFSHLIRSYLDQSGKKSISLQEETETLNRYLQLEALRFGEDFSMQMEIDVTLDLEIIKIPPMIIQPYVENGIRHGLFNKTGAKLLGVLIEKEGENMLKCVIQDNGIGRESAAKIKASKPTMHKSFALGATQSRIELYNQQSKSKISIEVTDLYDKENNATGTKIDLLIPIQT